LLWPRLDLPVTSLLTADAALRAWLTTAHTPWLDAIMWTASLIGQSGFAWLVIGAGAALVRPSLAPKVWQLALAVLVCHLVVDGVIKPAVARARPFHATAGVRVVGDEPVTYSFPSGHAASACACAFLLAGALPRARGWFWALAALIAASRVYIGVHYPLDVAAGALIGIGVGVLVGGGRACYSQGSLAGRAGPHGA
jgi:undecaprenyl-diphosphatase